MCECEKKPDGVNAQLTRTGKVRGGQCGVGAGA